MSSAWSGRELDRDRNPVLETAPNKDAVMTPERRKYLLSMSTIGNSVLAAEAAAKKYSEEIAAGVDKASQNNAENLVRVAKDGGRNQATERAGRQQQNAKDTTTPIGADRTRDKRDVGRYATAISAGSQGTNRQRTQRKGRFAVGDNR